MEADKLRSELIQRGAIIGQNVHFGVDVHVEMENAFLLEIHDGVVVGSFVKLVMHDSSLNNADPGSHILYGRIILRKNCFIGRDTLVLPGSDIGEGSIIGAGSLVKGTVNPSSVYLGRPAKYHCSIEQLKNKWSHNAQSSNNVFFVRSPKWSERTPEDDLLLEKMKKELFEKMKHKSQ